MTFLRENYYGMLKCRRVNWPAAIVRRHCKHVGTCML